MLEDDEAVIAVRRRILALKDELIAMSPQVVGINADAGDALTRARSALFQAWTLIVGPPDDEEDDH